LGLLIAGLALLVGAAAIVIVVTKSSPKGLFPTGSGTGAVSWSSSNGYEGSSTITGEVQGMTVSATATSSQNGRQKGSISGTIGGKPLSALLLYSANGYGETITGTYGGQPLSGSETEGYGDHFAVRVHGVIEGQPVSGILTSPQRFQPHTFSFSGTIGNLSVNGTASTSEYGFTSSQHVG